MDIYIRHGSIYCKNCVINTHTHKHTERQTNNLHPNKYSKYVNWKWSYWTTTIGFFSFFSYYLKIFLFFMTEGYFFLLSTEWNMAEYFGEFLVYIYAHTNTCVCVSIVTGIKNGMKKNENFYQIVVSISFCLYLFCS